MHLAAVLTSGLRLRGAHKLCSPNAPGMVLDTGPARRWNLWNLNRLWSPQETWTRDCAPAFLFFLFHRWEYRSGGEITHPRVIQLRSVDSNPHLASHGLPRWLSSKASACQCRRPGFDPWVRKFPWKREWQPNPVSLPGEFHGERSLESYSPWEHKESDKTERLTQ